MMINRPKHLWLQRTLCSLVLGLAIWLPVGAQHARQDHAAAKPGHSGHSHHDDELDALLNRHDQEIHFTENLGQFGPSVLFRADFPLGQAVATPEGMLVTAFDPAAVEARQREGIAIEEEMHDGKPMRPLVWNQRGHGWLMHFRNASETMRVVPKDHHEEVSHYFLGDRNHATNVRSHQEVWYQDVYKGTDVRYYPAADGSLEYDIICKPGSDPRQVAIEFKGIDKLRVNDRGELVMSSSLGEMTYPAPYVYQRVNGRESEISSAYVVEGDNILRFQLGAYAKDQPLVIDPIAMRWATWVNTNSSGDNHGHAIWVDPSDGAIYVVARVVGTTDQITMGAFDVTANGNLETIIGKYVEPSTVGGQGARVWQTYIGGNGDDNPYAMEQGPDGNLYITGQTSSTNFPLLGGTAFSGGSLNQQAESGIDVFVLKITQDGQSIKAAVVGGNGADDNYDVRTAPNGDVFVCGSTTSTNLLTLNGGSGASNTNNGGSDVFLFRINQDLSSLVWMRNYGGSGSDRASIMLHNPVSGDLFVGGNTSSTNFPTVSPRQSTRGGTTAGFLQRLTGAGATTWSSYFSSDANDDANLLCMEFSANRSELYFGGVTEGLNSANISAGSYDTGHNGSNDFYVARMTIDQGFLNGTYIGGSGNEVNMMGLNTDQNNDVYVFGYTNSTNFPMSTSPNVPLQTTNQGSNDKVFLKLESNLSALEFSTYYGGTSDDYDPVGERGIKFSNCRIYTIITSQSNNIPLTQGALNTTKNSPTSRYEPGLVVWANPPDLLGNTINYQGVSICPGSVPGNITGSVPSYTLPTIVRNNSASTYPSFGSAASYQWQTSPDSLTWTDIAGATAQDLPGSAIGAIAQDTYFRRIIGGDACILAGAADQVVKVRIMTVSGTVADALCSGAASGSITATADGQAPFTYAWSNGQTSPTATGLLAGSYSVNVTDANGCTASATFNVGQPSPVSANIQTGPATCGNSNGSATANGTGGTPGYSYTWSNGTFGPSISGVPAGNYSVTVTDLNQCSTVIPVVIPGTVPPEANAGDAAEINCVSGPTVQLSGSSPTPDMSFSWSGPGIVSNANTPTPTVNAAGTYTLTVTNPQTQCISTDQVTVSIDTTVPGAQAAGGVLNCTVSSIQLQGTGNGTFAWSGPNGFTSNEQNPTVSTAGTYTLVVTGANGCTSQASTEVSLDDELPGAQAAGGVLNCNVSSIQLIGTGNGTFAWSGPNGFTSNEQNPTVSAAGTYTLVVTGANGCTSQASADVVNDSEALSAEVSATLIGCDGEPAELSFTSNLSATLITWTGPDGFLANTPVAYASTPGSYTLVLVGANGCSSEFTVEVIIDPNCDDSCPPVIIACPPDITVSCAEDFSPFGIGGEPIWRKNPDCPEITSLGWEDEILSNCPYVIRRTYWAEDAVGEYGTCSHLITVIDDIAPVLMNVPEDLVVECSAVSDDMSVPDVWAYDECSKSNVPVEVKVDVLQGDCLGSYSMVYTWTATDACGNVGTASWTIHVVDLTGPVLSCDVEDMTVTEGQIPEAAKCEAWDACSGEVEVYHSEEQLKTDACKDGYALLRTWTARDACGNTTSVQQTITVCGKDLSNAADLLSPWNTDKDGDAGMKASVSPNPFRNDTHIDFTAPVAGDAVVEVYDMQGRRIADLYRGVVAKDQALRLNFRPVENGGGTFLYRILLNGEELKGRMLYQP
jgi:hypothetical protein